MDLKDAASLFHFRELHLLERVIFFVGSVLLIGSFFVKTFIVGFAGVGMIFAATTLNLVVDMTLRFGFYFKKKPGHGIPWALLWQALVAIALTATTLLLAFYFYRHGEMPPWLRPIPNRIDIRPGP
jgi:hypothetical protein